MNPRYREGKRDFESRAFNRALPPLRKGRINYHDRLTGVKRGHSAAGSEFAICEGPGWHRTLQLLGFKRFDSESSGCQTNQS